jgi:hypothetical protein
LSGFGDDSSNYFWKIGAAEAIMRRSRTDPAGLARQAGRFSAPLPAAAAGEPHALGAVPGLRVPAGAELRAEAAALAVYVGAQVKAISAAPALAVTRAGGAGFDVSRRYASHAQALAFQYVLDRLRVLNVIVWSRDASEIHITVSRDAAKLEPLLTR